MKKILSFISIHRLFFIFFLALVFFYMIWWLAFFPGVMTPDSLEQWTQAHYFQFHNWHPFIYALIMSFLKVFYSSPAVMGILQILMISFFIAGVFFYARKRGVGWLLIIPIFTIYLLHPQFGIYNVTIWKDILYSISLVILSFITFYLIAESNSEFKAKAKVSLIFFAVLTALLRHNGIVFMALPFFLMVVFNKNRRQEAIRLFFVSVVFFFIFTLGVSRAIGVVPAPLLMDQIRVKMVSAIYQKEKPVLSDNESWLFEELVPKNNWIEHYNCTNSMNLFYNDLLGSKGFSYKDQSFLSEEAEKRWHWYSLTASFKNIDAQIMDHVCFSKYLLGIESNPYKFGVSVEDIPDKVRVLNESKMPEVKEKLVDYLIWSSQDGIYSHIFWAVWPGLLMYAGFLGFSFTRNKRGTASYIILISANTLIMVLVSPGADHRFVYSSYLGMFLLPILFVSEKNSRDNRSEKIRIH